MTDKELAAAAMYAMKKAYAPYSGYKVGAAILAGSGSVYEGCNVENASYGATVCAERAAACKAVSCGEREFKAIAIVGGPNGVIKDVAPPCGICRQVLSEFSSENLRVILCGADMRLVTTTLGELFPLAFKKDSF